MLRVPGQRQQDSGYRLPCHVVQPFVRLPVGRGRYHSLPSAWLKESPPLRPGRALVSCTHPEPLSEKRPRHATSEVWVQASPSQLVWPTSTTDHFIRAGRPSIVHCQLPLHQPPDTVLALAERVVAIRAAPIKRDLSFMLVTPLWKIDGRMIGGKRRCVITRMGEEFIHPVNWRDIVFLSSGLFGRASSLTI